MFNDRIKNDVPVIVYTSRPINIFKRLIKSSVLNNYEILNRGL